MNLLNCPFCGAHPHKNLGKVWHDSLHGDRHQDTVIKCPHLCATMSGSASTVVDRWNTRAELALVAEAYEVAAKYHDNFLMVHTGVTVEKVVASTEAIRALTPADAIAAREARDKQVREQALREAADRVVHYDDGGFSCRNAILALIEKDKPNE